MAMLDSSHPDATEFFSNFQWNLPFPTSWGWLSWTVVRILMTISGLLELIVGEGTFYICWMVEFKFKCCVPLTMDLHYSPEICSLLHDTKNDASLLMVSNYHFMVITGLKWTVGQWRSMFWNDKWLIMNGYLVAIPWLQWWLIIEKQ